MNRNIAFSLLIAASAPSLALAEQLSATTTTSVLVTSGPRGPFETVDGSARVGFIVADLTDQKVLFSPCKGTPFAVAQSELRETAVPCEEEPGKPPEGIWVWGQPGADATFISASAREVYGDVNCEDVPSQVETAIADIAAGIAEPGTIYDYQSEGSVVVSRLDDLETGSEPVLRQNRPCATITSGTSWIGLGLEAKADVESWFGTEIQGDDVLLVYPLDAASADR